MKAILIFAIAMLMGTHTLAAKVYQWTDENGQIHYSQFPPADAQKQAQEVNVKAPKAADADKAAERLNKLRDELKQNVDNRGKKTEDEQVAEENAKIKADNCVKAKDQLRELQNHGRIYKTLESGERHWYDEKEREELIANAKKQVDEFCN